MKLLVIGDVHGCYYTLKELVEKHWHPGEEILIQLGDLINKGPYSGKCIKYWQELEKNIRAKRFFYEAIMSRCFWITFLPKRTRNP